MTLVRDRERVCLFRVCVVMDGNYNMLELYRLREDVIRILKEVREGVMANTRASEERRGREGTA